MPWNPNSFEFLETMSQTVFVRSPCKSWVQFLDSKENTGEKDTALRQARTHEPAVAEAVAVDAEGGVVHALLAQQLHCQRAAQRADRVAGCGDVCRQECGDGVCTRAAAAWSVPGMCAR